MYNNFLTQALANIFSNEITAIFAIVLASVFVIAFVPTMFWHRPITNFSRNSPSILMTIGVLGTFVGIYIGLLDFNVSNIEDSIPKLLDGLKIAFMTSVLGMFLGVGMKIIQTLPRYRQQKTGVTSADIYSELTNISDGIKKSGESSKELLNEIKRSISSDSDTSLITQVQKLRTSNIDTTKETQSIIEAGFNEQIGEFKNFAEKMTENNSSALIEALEEVIKDFNTKISEQFGENFKKLNEAVGGLLEWQNKYKDHVEKLTDNFELALKGIESARDAISKNRRKH